MHTVTITEHNMNELRKKSRWLGACVKRKTTPIYPGQAKKVQRKMVQELALQMSNGVPKDTDSPAGKGYQGYLLKSVSEPYFPQNLRGSRALQNVMVLVLESV